MSDEAKKVDDGGPAFPLDRWQYGMSLRDWYAGMAMQGYIANPTSFGPPIPEALRGNVELITEISAIFAYKVADAMIERRKW